MLIDPPRAPLDRDAVSLFLQDMPSGMIADAAVERRRCARDHRRTMRLTSAARLRMVILLIGKTFALQAGGWGVLT